MSEIKKVKVEFANGAIYSAKTKGKSVDAAIAKLVAKYGKDHAIAKVVTV